MSELQETSGGITEADRGIIRKRFRDEINKTNGEILRMQPPTIRRDEGTGAPARPLLYLQGMNGDKKLPWQLRELAASEQREIIAVTFDKLVGSTNAIPTAAIDPEKNDVPEVDKI